MKQFLVLKLIPTIFLSGTLLAGCSDEPSCPDNTEEFRPITDWAESRIPYHGFDTLRFVTNTGDTLTCKGEGRIYGVEQEMQHLGEPVCNSHHTIRYEAYSIKFSSEKDFVNLFHSADVSPTGGLIIKWSNVGFDINVKAISNKVFTFYSFYDSLNINGNNYYEVTGLNSGQDSIYLNKDNGVLLIKLPSQSKTLTIVK